MLALLDNHFDSQTMTADILSLPPDWRVNKTRVVPLDFYLGGATVRNDSRRRMVAVGKAPPTQSFLS